MASKKEIFKVKSVPVDPKAMGEPATSVEFQKRGMAYYARKQYDLAEKDYKDAIALDATNIDAAYGLGMVYKATGRKEPATQSFKQVISLLSQTTGSGDVGATMLRRLALGHINEMTQGDWNLEKEIWKHIP